MAQIKSKSFSTPLNNKKKRRKFDFPTNTKVCEKKYN